MDDRIIRDLLDGQNFDFVKIKYGLYKYQLLDIIINYFCKKSAQLNIEEQEIIKNIYIKNASMLDLENEKVMLVSDTHMGGIYQRDDYLKFVFDYCKDNGIHTLMHAGDIADGRGTKDGNPAWFKNENEARANAELVLSNYPTSSELTQYVIAGNHEVFYERENVNFFEELGKKQNVVLMGEGNAFFTVYEYPILLAHDIAPVQDGYSLNLISYYLTIMGHSHISRFNNNQIYLPTLSYNIIHKNEKGGFPGCMVMQTFNDDDIIRLQFERIYFIPELDDWEAVSSRVYTLKK